MTPANYTFPLRNLYKKMLLQMIPSPPHKRRRWLVQWTLNTFLQCKKSTIVVPLGQHIAQADNHYKKFLPYYTFVSLEHKRCKQ